MSFSLWLSIILCQVLWAIMPSVTKVLVLEVGAYEAAWIKYGGACLGYLGFRTIYGIYKNRVSEPNWFFFRPIGITEKSWVFWVGLTTIFGASVLQCLGLQRSTAAVSSLMVAVEPTFTALVGYIFLREKLQRSHLISLVCGLIGLYGIFHSDFSQLGSAGATYLSFGNLALLLSILCEAMYTIGGKKLSLLRKNDSFGIPFFGSVVLIGFFLLTLFLFYLGRIPSFTGLSIKAWLAIIWIGPFNTVFPYLIWIRAINRNISIIALAITLFIQPLVGVLAGMIWHHEHINAAQIIGGALIALGVCVQILIDSRK